ncbi:hypothetical protein LH464_24315 [Neorhizobium sp. T786]|uniref:hypothetical protein n=1 Tax=Pseudorhizobium xiangyangii TaxID=2883104 RepID=UPI001CFFBE7A|nr:hypothetical protein [Neorhizobium xiangyangii]MCB5205560.1 hypothetical protein [Neorhizobium xiangyangii]
MNPLKHIYPYLSTFFLALVLVAPLVLTASLMTERRTQSAGIGLLLYHAVTRI